MGLTTERKVFLGLACVAGLALVIDQGLLGPSEAGAQPTLVGADMAIDFTEPIQSQDLIQSQEVVTISAVLMDRLDGIVSESPSDTTSPLGSVFSLTQLVKPVPAEPVSNDQIQILRTIDQSPESSFPLIAAKPTDLPILTALMPTKNGGGAVLNGKLLRSGEIDDTGYRLVLVHARSVIVERDGNEYVIEIPMNLSQE